MLKFYLFFCLFFCDLIFFIEMNVNCLVRTCVKNVCRVPDLNFHKNSSSRSLDIGENVLRSSCKVPLLAYFDEA